MRPYDLYDLFGIKRTPWPRDYYLRFLGLHLCRRCLSNSDSPFTSSKLMLLLSKILCQWTSKTTKRGLKLSRRREQTFVGYLNT